MTQHSVVRSSTEQQESRSGEHSVLNVDIYYLRAVRSVAGGLGVPDILGVRGEGELGVSAVVLQGREVNLQQAAGLEVGVAAVCAGLAAPDLLHHVLVQSVRVAVVGDVEEHVDLLHVLHEAARDILLHLLLLLRLPVDHPRVHALRGNLRGRRQGRGQGDQAKVEEGGGDREHGEKYLLVTQK